MKIEWGPRFNQAIDQVHSISDRYNILQSINLGYDSDGYVGPNIATLKDWSLVEMQEVLATTDWVEERDAKVMVELGEQNVDLLIGKYVCVIPLQIWLADSSLKAVSASNETW